MYVNKLKLMGLIKSKHKSVSNETLAAASEWTLKLSWYRPQGCLVLFYLYYMCSLILNTNWVSIIARYWLFTEIITCNHHCSNCFNFSGKRVRSQQLLFPLHLDRVVKGQPQNWDPASSHVSPVQHTSLRTTTKEGGALMRIAVFWAWCSETQRGDYSFTDFDYYRKRRSGSKKKENHMEVTTRGGLWSHLWREWVSVLTTVGRIGFEHSGIQLGTERTQEGWSSGDCRTCTYCLFSLPIWFLIANMIDIVTVTIMNMPQNLHMNPLKEALRCSRKSTHF